MSNDKGKGLFTWREHLTFGEKHAVPAVALMEIRSWSQSDSIWCHFDIQGLEPVLNAHTSLCLTDVILHDWMSQVMTVKWKIPRHLAMQN